MNRMGLPESLLSRIEDAGINASAAPQQRWIDGWLVRFSPGKAKRARCIHAVANGRLPIDERFGACAAVYREAGLPLFVRVTPFSLPAGLDDWLAGQGHHAVDDTRVMVSTALPTRAEGLPDGIELCSADAATFSEAVGVLRDSPMVQRRAHAERLQASPVPYQGWMLQRRDDGAVLACGQIATEGDLVGIYDVFTHPDQRGQGLARRLCSAMLARAAAAGARLAYLQVDAVNVPARSIYHGLGFDDAYAYHYRTPQADAH